MSGQDVYDFSDSNASPYGSNPVNGNGIGGQQLDVATMARMPTAFRTANTKTAVRPTTSSVAVGYTGNKGDGKRPATAWQKQNNISSNRGGGGDKSSAFQNDENRIMRNFKEIEKGINKLLEESSISHSRGNVQLGLKKAKEAAYKERQLIKQREQANQETQNNPDLTYSVTLQLAIMYHANSLYDEAINTFSVLVKNKDYIQAGRLRVNMGNVYFDRAVKERKPEYYSSARKQFQMAHDHVGAMFPKLRHRILRNIGNTYIKEGLFQDALESFEVVLDSAPDMTTGFNLLICYYALGDIESVQRTFRAMLNIRGYGIDQVEEDLQDVMKNDSLSATIAGIQGKHKRCLLQAAQLIAPMIGSDVTAGYDWIISTLKVSAHYSELVSDMEMAKAMSYLKDKQFDLAIETLKSFEKQDSKLASAASTNLSFLYFHEGDYNQAAKHAEAALTVNPESTRALVNLGNCAFMQSNYEKAISYYEKASAHEVNFFEAEYNIGLSLIKLGKIESAQAKFNKIKDNSPESYFQLGSLFAKQGQFQAAIKEYSTVLTFRQTDPKILSMLGDLYTQTGQAIQGKDAHVEAFNYHPVDLSVISWLGVYHLNRGEFKQGLRLFQRAVQINPKQVKYGLSVGICYRRMNENEKALSTYLSLSRTFPQNITVLTNLIELYRIQGKHDKVAEYNAKLNAAQAAGEKQEDEQLKGPPKSLVSATTPVLGSGIGGPTPSGSTTPLAGSSTPISSLTPSMTPSAMTPGAGVGPATPPSIPKPTFDTSNVGQVSKEYDPARAAPDLQAVKIATGNGRRAEAKDDIEFSDDDDLPI